MCLSRRFHRIQQKKHMQRSVIQQRQQLRTVKGQDLLSEIFQSKSVNFGFIHKSNYIHTTKPYQKHANFDIF